MIKKKTWNIKQQNKTPQISQKDTIKLLAKIGYKLIQNIGDEKQQDITLKDYGARLLKEYPGLLEFI